MGAADDSVKSSGADPVSSKDVVKPDHVISGHSATPKTAAPGAVIDHTDINGKVDIRTFYGNDGMKGTEIHTGDHRNRKTHNYGIHGEHAHDYIWNEDGSINTRKRRELTTEERKKNGDILDKK